MLATIDDSTELLCYDKGRRCRLPADEAHRRFWAYDCAWVVPTDFYRWDIERHSGRVCVRDELQPAARSFGLCLYTRGTRCLTLSDLEAKQNTLLDTRAFQRRAARFGELHGALPIELRPFYYYALEDRGGLSQPAYCLRSSCGVFLIMDVVAKVGPSDDGVDWAAFEEPPVTTHAHASRT